MLSIRSIKIKGIEQRPNRVAARMILRAPLDTLIHIEFVVEMLTHRCRVDEEFECNMATMAVDIVSDS